MKLIYNNLLNNDCTTNYYTYIISIIKQIMDSTKKTISIDYNNFDINNINIHINLEHTLVKQGGRGINSNAELSQIKYNNIPYTIRITNEDSWKKSNIVIDYSMPNIINVEYSKDSNIINKQIYIPPILYEFNPHSSKRDINVLTTFINIYEPRRFMLINSLQENNIPHININNCFTLENNNKLLKNTKIILNIHQTEHHDTFEELRCLPALLCGTLVISEDSPLKEHIPYKDYIIWTSFDDINTTIIEVLNNYQEYYNKIFIKSDFNKLIDTMRKTSIKELTDKIQYNG
jgi:hypothetical protein